MEHTPDAAPIPARLLPYGIGFALSVALTALAFALVAYRFWPPRPTVAAVLVLACAQVLVHLRYFLHLDLSPAQRMYLRLLLLAAAIIALIVGGTAWIMQHLDYNLS